MINIWLTKSHGVTVNFALEKQTPKSFMKLFARYTNLFVFNFLLVFGVFAQQTGVLRGTIKDVKTKEDIIGATILLQGSTKGASTDINGFFNFDKLPAGTYSLKISFVGYQSKVYEDVKVSADQVTELNLTIAEESSTLAEVKVVAQRLTNTEVSVISEIKAAQLVVSGISAAQITKTLDSCRGGEACSRGYDFWRAFY